jgi:flavin reductase (DIM6/NTAB) family NADH-FMN oxidoreductase RutF
VTRERARRRHLPDADGSFPMGVAVGTTRAPDGDPAGMTASATLARTPLVHFRGACRWPA